MKNYVQEFMEDNNLKIGEEFKLDDGEYCYYFDRNFELRMKGFRLSAEALLQELLMGKHKIEHPILNEKEKEYLKNFLKPYDVIGIRLHNSIAHKFQRLRIEVRSTDIGGTSLIELPPFKPYTFYRGMIVDIKYTLEELGISHE